MPTNHETDIMTNVSNVSKELPTVGQLSPEAFIDIDPKFVLEVATGLEDIAEIAPRYGYDEETAEALRNYKPFLIEVDRHKAELYRSGKTFKLMAGMMAEEVMKKTFEQALLPETGLSVRIDALKTLAKLADLEPKQATGTVQGAGFSISINIGGTKPEVIEVKG